MKIYLLLQVSDEKVLARAAENINFEHEYCENVMTSVAVINISMNFGYKKFSEVDFFRMTFNPLMHSVPKNGRTHFKNLAAFPARLLKCV